MDPFWAGTFTAIGYLMQLALIPLLMLNRHKHPSSMAAWLITMLSCRFWAGCCS